MISLFSPSVSFKANEDTSVHDSYQERLNKNLQIVQQQNNSAMNANTVMTKAVPMQGTAQKLDVTA